VSRYPTRMTPTSWLIAFAMALPFAAFLLMVAAVAVFG
jgi:hypothetical protein